LVLTTRVSDYISETLSNDRINTELYGKYNVKRGLRNADGSGVLAGLTHVSEVHGYIINEEERTSVDGKLFYRGIDIEEIIAAAMAEKRFVFEEIVYLLLLGELPTRERLEGFTAFLGENRRLPRYFRKDSIMSSPSSDIMNKLARSVLTLYSYDENPEDHSPENVLRQCIELIARFPTIVAYAYFAKKYYFDNQSLVIHRPLAEVSTAENFLALIRPDQKFTHLEAEILDLLLVLHAEHGGGNNSTFTVHTVSSADTDTYSAIAAGIGSLKGYKHGGANIKVMSMMEDIKQNVKKWDDEVEVEDYLEKILKKQAFDGTGLIYGQGHAVYTKSDPRAILLRDKASALAPEKGLVDEFNLYRLIERLVPTVFKRIKESDKDICANVDFYSGFVYKMMDIPQELYTPLFAVSRVAGWCAHRLEEIVCNNRVIRPAYKCVRKHKAYIPLSQR
jgi:citrate synthase